MAKRGKKFRLGRHWITDDRTGIAHWDDQMTKQWDGLIVKKGSEETRHPQEYVRSLSDPYPVHYLRPEQGTDFDDICGFYKMEFIPNTVIRRSLSITDDLLPLPGIGQMSLGVAANECGHWFIVQAPSRILNVPLLAESNTSFSVPSTTHIVDLPDGITTGSRLILYISVDDVVTFAWPSGWTVLFSDTNSTLSLDVAYLDVDGTEGFTGTDDIITVTTNLERSSSHMSHRIIGFDPATAPEASTGATGSSTSPDPDAITPSSGNTDYLIFAVEAHNTGSTTTTPPTNYSNQIQSKTN